MLTLIQQVRLTVQDNTPGFYMLSDDEIQFLLDRNEQNVDRASLEAARAILFQLAQRGDETVDIFSIRGSKAAEQYRLALQFFLNNPTMNPLMKDVGIYVGGISKEDMKANDENLDNNVLIPPNKDRPPLHRFPYGWTIVP